MSHARVNIGQECSGVRVVATPGSEALQQVWQVRNPLFRELGRAGILLFALDEGGHGRDLRHVAIGMKLTGPGGM